ncbi:acyltransferase [Rhodococcus sp. 05-2254-6]|uniref:acyltransferase n=1 Tax=Rhodococcus sp. 05-2254-6 TaxID=2022489 RepID=UPI0027BAE801|nr:acyltransferase [Rhodococcus sp. 05-2254-6]
MNLRTLGIDAINKLIMQRRVLRAKNLSFRLRSIGTGSSVSQTAKIYNKSYVSIGSNTSLNDYVHIWGGGIVEIGDDSLIAAHVVITSETHDIDALGKGLLYRQTRQTSPVRIGNNVWIGSGAIVLPGVTIGDNSVVAAGAVVTKNIEANSLAVGVPARTVRSLL